MITRLKNEELLNENHFPLQLVFNMVTDERFIKIITFISEGVGFGEDYGACTFPGDLDEFDIANGEGFEGVEFGLHSGEEILLDYQTFYYYLKKICENYTETHPEKFEELQECLKRYQNRYNLN